MISRYRSPVLLVAVAIVILAAASPAQAQRSFEPLFDKFNFSLQGSWIGLSTEIGLDSETLGTGTTLNFEDDLGLSSSEAIPSIAFEWQIAKKHRLAVRWQDINLANVNADVENIEDSEGNPEFTARVDMNINDISIFARVRF